MSVHSDDDRAGAHARERAGICLGVAPHLRAPTRSDRSPWRSRSTTGRRRARGSCCGCRWSSARRSRSSPSGWAGSCCRPGRRVPTDTSSPAGSAPAHAALSVWPAIGRPVIATSPVGVVAGGGGGAGGAGGAGGPVPAGGGGEEGGEVGPATAGGFACVPPFGCFLTTCRLAWCGALVPGRPGSLVLRSGLPIGRRGRRRADRDRDRGHAGDDPVRVPHDRLELQPLRKLGGSPCLETRDLDLRRLRQHGVLRRRFGRCRSAWGRRDRLPLRRGP